MYVTNKSGYVSPNSKEYYVYILCKPCGEVFYVGKGKNYRLNAHFQKSALDRNTRKNSVIREYGASVKRDIISYFDEEGSAFDFEEFLVAQYGLIEDGGTLTNVARTRSEYSEYHRKVSKRGSQTRVKKFSDEQVIQVYKDYFTNNKARSDIYRPLGMSEGYFHSLVVGHRSKALYAKYIKSGKIEDRRRVMGIRSTRIIPDSDMPKLFKEYYELRCTAKSLADRYDYSASHLSNIFKGKARHYLLEEYKAACTPLGGGRIRAFPEEELGLLEAVSTLRKSGLDFNEISEALSLPRNVISAYLNKLRRRGK